MLAAALPAGPVTGVGLISGTSADGIDAAAVTLCEEGGRPRMALRAFCSVPYPDAVRAALFRCFEGQVSLSEFCLLHARVGDLFAAAAEAVLAEAGPEPPLAFVASHGQTVWHEPPAGERRGASLQIGEAARITARLGVPVVSDFRQQDLALGGQGAPLVPYVDYLLLTHAVERRAVQNLGGIGNVTYLPAGAPPEAVLAFDTGPGNALIDAAAALVSGGALACDLDGRLAAGAPVDAAWLKELLADPYFALAPPKSTGRERFGTFRVRAWWDAGHRGPGLVSTLTQLTVESIARAYRRWLGPVDRVILAGGGARNPELVRRLAAALVPAAVSLPAEVGLDGDAKEAMAFALLGYETLRGRPSNLPAATGAARPVIQGKICRV